MTTTDDALTILAYIAEQDMHDAIFWRCDGQYAPITIWVNCNDLFYWATADCEELTIENLPVLKQAVVDIDAVGPVLGILHAPALFACRVRGMRPQQPAYPHGDYIENEPKLRALFDACGPPRDAKDEG